MDIKDALGIGPIAEAAKRVTDGAVDAASAFLSRICLPAAEEFGLLLRDKVREWRASNAVKIATKADAKLRRLPGWEGRHAHPRLVGQILEHGSWSEADEVQEMWGGLLAASCTEDGKDDSNLMFVDFLSRLSLSQVCILDYACKSAEVQVTLAGWLTANFLTVDLPKLRALTGTDDTQRLDRELDHLRALGLLSEQHGGFAMLSTNAGLTPTPLALQMYARCNGHRGSPPEFYRKLGTLRSAEGAV